jgi:hypothetical protein
MLKRFIIIIIVLLSVSFFFTCDTVTQPETKDIEYYWTQREPLGAYFNLELYHFKGDTVKAYLWNDPEGKKYSICNSIVLRKQELKKSYIQTNMHYAKFILKIYVNGKFYLSKEL